MATNLMITQHGGVLQMVIKSGDDNRFDYPALGAMTGALLAAGDDDSVRAVVLRGEGRDFSHGDAWPEMGEWPEDLPNRVPAGSHGAAPLPEQRALTTLRNLMKPTIALMHGHTLGLALDLAAVCDIRLTHTGATIGDPRIHQARAAATGISYVLPRLIGQSQAMRILLKGELLDGAEALRIQLAHHCYADEAFEAAAAEEIERISKLPTRAWAVRKMQVIPQLDMSYDAAVTHCLGVRQTHVIEDIAEGRAAFREKRKPEFSGR